MAKDPSNGAKRRHDRNDMAVRRDHLEREINARSTVLEQDENMARNDPALDNIALLRRHVG